MSEEIEIKFLEINKEELENKIVELGGVKVFERNYQRIVFDYSDFRLDKQGAWIRLRDEGEDVKLTFKQRLGMKSVEGTESDEGMYEKEIVVSSFLDTREILLKTGLIEKMYQENKRTRYFLDGVELDIDEWPLLNPYLEVEGKTWDDVYRVSEKLGFKKEDAKIFSANQIYKLNGLDDRNFTKLTFKEQIKRTENLF
jgi:adenylate cyclase class 2